MNTLSNDLRYDDLRRSPRSLWTFAAQTAPEGIVVGKPGSQLHQLSKNMVAMIFEQPVVVTKLPAAAEQPRTFDGPLGTSNHWFNAGSSFYEPIAASDWYALWGETVTMRRSTYRDPTN